MWIIGDGEKREELNSIKKDESINNVELKGFYSNPYPLLKQAYLYICSSLYEGYSTAVSESICLGAPVLTTNCSGMDEILDNGKYGMIVDNDEDSLYNGLIKILSDKKIYYNYKNAVVKHSEELRSKTSLLEYLNLFNNLNK